MKKDTLPLNRLLPFLLGTLLAAIFLYFYINAKKSYRTEPKHSLAPKKELQSQKP